MRPELTRLVFDVPTCLGFFAFFFAVTFLLAWRALPAEAAFKEAVLAAFTLGLRRSKEGPDLFVPGALATLFGIAPLVLRALQGKPLEVPLASYPIAMSAAFLACIAITVPRAKRRGIPVAHVLDLAIMCLVAGPVGARIFFVAQFWEQHFADRPAQLTIGTVAALSSSDELLVVSSNEKGGSARPVTFKGDETTFEKLDERLRAAHLRSKLVTLDWRAGESVEHRVRGVVIESEARGDEATLEAHGSAAEKLGIADGPEHGKTVALVETLKLWNGGMVFYGGLGLAALACLAYIRARKHRLALVADVVAPVLPLGMALGRVGCFLNGCCFGRELAPSSPVAVRFPVLSFPWMLHAKAALSASWDRMLEQGVCPPPLHGTDLDTGSHFVHPAQLYSVAVDFVLFLLVLLFGSRFARREGQTFFFFLLLEPICRFTVEHFRGDNTQFIYALGYPLTAGQIVALATLPVGAVGLAWSSRRGKPMVAQVLPENPPHG